METESLRPYLNNLAKSIADIVIETTAPRDLHIYNKGFLTTNNTTWQTIAPLVTGAPLAKFSSNIFIHCIHLCGNGVTLKIRKYKNYSIVEEIEYSIPLWIGVDADIDIESATPHTHPYIKYFEIESSLYIDRPIYRSMEIPVFEFQNTGAEYDQMDFQVKGQQDAGELYGDVLICYDCAYGENGIDELPV
jgi:hypothetical protein